MAYALLLTTALALGGFLVTSLQGFLVGSGIGSGAAKVLVTRHVGYAIPTVLLSLFSQSMVIFYFIGTGKLVKEDIVELPEDEKRAVVGALRRFKAQTSPAATFSLLSAITVFVLGGAAHTRALPSWVHLVSALVAVATHFWALKAEWRVFGENNRLMGDPGRFSRELLRAAGGSPISGPAGKSAPPRP
ncbi:MAG: hypothetical protein M3167_17315 [Acidobacteriota bacterium]|nr:hypothetical protein [Acidobacteriota bacterium]